jgi:phosphodiesterase/alkaline phosphatase D-like protein
VEVAPPPLEVPLKPSRRSLLAGISAIPIAGFTGCTEDGKDEVRNPEAPSPAPDRLPEPAAWDAPGTLDEIAFPWGVQAGDAFGDGVIVSLRTDEPVVRLTVVGATDDGWEEVAVHPDLVPTDGHLRIVLSGLEADRAHRYVFHAADGERRSRPGRFRTAGTASRKIVFGATSCLGTENPALPGLARAAEEDLDFVLLVGDIVYADGSLTLADYRAVWDAQMRVASIQALTASTSVIAAWDDHEIANNWTKGDPAFGQVVVTDDQLGVGSRAFLDAIPQTVAPGEPMWRQLRWGDVLEVFVLDCRGERETGLRIVSDAQLAWITGALAASTATFKIVVASVHVTDHLSLLSVVAETDRWQGYPDQRRALLEAAEAVPGVLFVTGDMHYGAVQRVGAPGEPGEDLWEVAAGPSGSELFPIVDIGEILEAGIPPQYVELVQDWNWARFEVDPALGEIRVQLVDDRGEIAAERVLQLS